MAKIESQPRVLVIGGGIGNCGLAIATGLKKAGITYTVFERDNEFDFTHKTRDWGMLLHWGTEYLNKMLPSNLQARIKETYVDPNIDMVDPVPYMNAQTGEILQKVETPTISRVSRAKLRNFLTEGEGLNIKFEKKLQKVAVEGETVIAEFEDGIRETGTMIIGSDGSHSAVREFLVGHEAAKLEDTGHQMINYAAEGYTPEQAHLLRSFHPILQLCYNHPAVPGASLLAALDIRDPNDTANWRFQAYTSWSGPPYVDDLQDDKVRMKFVEERMSQFCEPFRTAFLAQIAQGKIMPVYPGHQWAPRMQWDNHGGRVTIAGDAAHSVLPHRGQGLNNALKDASDIVDAVKAASTGTKSLAAGITEYEEEMRERGSTEVDLSYQQMKAGDKKELEDSPMFKMGHGKNTATKDHIGVNGDV